MELCCRQTRENVSLQASTLCATDGQHDCASCAAGYRMSANAAVGSQTCLANVCACPNGTPTVAGGSGATLCVAHGDGDCSGCSAGYVPQRQTTAPCLPLDVSILVG